METAEKMGFSMNVGPEAEFFLFSKDKEGNVTTDTQDSAGYYDVGPEDLGEDVRSDIVLTLQEMGFDIEASHHEVADGQHEIDFRYADILTAADNVTTFRVAVKAVAAQHHLHATFMPKPIFGINVVCTVTYHYLKMAKTHSLMKKLNISYLKLQNTQLVVF